MPNTPPCISTVLHHAQHALFQSLFNLFINVYEFYHSLLNSMGGKKNNSEGGALQKASKLLTCYSRTSSEGWKKVITQQIHSPWEGWACFLALDLPGPQPSSPAPAFQKPHLELKSTTRGSFFFRTRQQAATSPSSFKEHETDSTRSRPRSQPGGIRLSHQRAPTAAAPAAGGPRLSPAGCCHLPVATASLS